MAGNRPRDPSYDVGQGSKITTIFLVLLLACAYPVQSNDDVTNPSVDTCGPPESDEIRLHRCLLANLEPTVRPAKTANETIQVTFGYMMVKILDLDEKAHIFTTMGWMHHQWTDFQLKWNPDHYGGLKQIRLPIDKIWTPDITLFNNADESFRVTSDNLAVISSDGSVTWVPVARARSYCTLDLRRFPFDTQSCTTVYGSWTHDTKAVNISLKTTKEFPDRILNGQEWEITTTNSKRHEWSYQPHEQYAGIVTTIGMRRTSSFYQYVFIMPTVIFACAMLIIPFINPLSQEKITFCVALLLGCTMILMMLERHMPTELGNVPVVAAYLAYLMVMSIISLIVSVLVTNMYHRDPKQGKVPGWIKWSFLTKLNKLVCYNAELYTALPTELAIEENSVERELLEIRVNGTEGSQLPDGKSQMERTMEDIRRYLRVCAARASIGAPSASHQDLVRQEWRQVAIVIDRLMFISTLVLTVVITISMYAHY